MAVGQHVLVVDLNNFARYPTVGVGYLAAILRQAGMRVSVFSPLMSGVTGVVREPRAKPWGLIDQRLRYWSALSTSPLVKRVREKLASRHGPALARQTEQVAADFERQLRADPPQAVLVSTYLMYKPLCERIATMCRAMKIPVLIGGPYFAQKEVADDWTAIPNVSGVVGGEVEYQLPDIIGRMTEGRPLAGIPGVWTRNGVGAKGTIAPPLTDLDGLPFPDYSDFPWDRYPNRIIPLITGRGCGWGACTFCSDVTSTIGRTFRSRSAANVLAEIAEQSKRYATRLFAFTDLKMNSNLDVWHALLERFAHSAPGAQWIGAVHIGARQPNGLGPEELKAARAAGMVRLTTGLESGSQRVLDRMAKGTDLAVTTATLQAAKAAGISVRTTMIVGYPGEEPDDVEASAKYLEEHDDCIERVSLNRFLIMSGTRFEHGLARQPQQFPGVTQVTVNHRIAQIDHHYTPTETRAWRRALGRLLAAVHRINRRELAPDARQFEGVM